MSSQNSPFMDNLDSNVNRCKDVLIMFQEESILLRKLEYMEDIVDNYLPGTFDVNIDIHEILSKLMPESKEILEQIFEKTIELVYENDGEICRQTLETIQEYLQMAMSLLENLKGILNIIHDKEKCNLSNAKNLPIYVGQILYTTFLHCKESNSIYKKYFESLDSILLVFKKAQEVHSKYLNILENCIVYNLLVEEEALLFANILDNVSEIGDILSGMNVKAMADNWRSYANLAQKYSSELSKYINIERPILHFTSELIKNLRSVSEMESMDKSVAQILKVSNFLLKVLLKICDSFLGKVVLHVGIFWNFFLEFYSVHSQAVKIKKGVDDNTVDAIQSYVYNGVEQLLRKFIERKEFFDVSLLDALIAIADCPYDFLLVSSVILQKLSSDQSFDDDQLDFSNYLNIIFIALQKSYILFMKGDKVYQQLCTACASLSVASNREEFAKIELILCRNLFSSHMWNAMFAYEILIIIAGTCNPKYAFHFLCELVTNFEIMLKSHYTSSPQFVILNNVLSDLYQMLDVNLKKEFLQKYPLMTHLHVWKCIKLNNVPRFYLGPMENHLVDTVEKMEKFDTGKCTYEDFIDMVDAMYLLASFPFDQEYFDLKRLNAAVMTVWDFDGTNKDLLNSNIFKLFFDNLSKLTTNLVWRFNHSQLLEIAQRLKLICSNDTSFSFSTISVLNAILNQTTSRNQQDLHENIMETFALLLPNSSPSIIALEVFSVLNNSSNNIDVDLINKNANLRRIMLEFAKKKRENNPTTTSKSYVVLDEIEFRHECLEHRTLEPIVKRMKISENYANLALQRVQPVIAMTESYNKIDNPQLSRTIQRIKKDVQYLCNIAGKDDLTMQNFKDMNFIVKELQSYV